MELVSRVSSADSLIHKKYLGLVYEYPKEESEEINKELCLDFDEDLHLKERLSCSSGVKPSSSSRKTTDSFMLQQRLCSSSSSSNRNSSNTNSSDASFPPTKIKAVLLLILKTCGFLLDAHVRV